MKLRTWAQRTGICYKTARLYGQRRAKRKTEKIVQDLNVKVEQKTPQEGGEERAAR